MCAVEKNKIGENTACQDKSGGVAELQFETPSPAPKREHAGSW